jgi:prevent-host-death family protein
MISLTTFRGGRYLPAATRANLAAEKPLGPDASLMKTMDASKARQSLAGVLDFVRAHEESIVIVRYGHPMAALVPIGRLDSSERKRLKGKGRSARVERRRP